VQNIALLCGALGAGVAAKPAKPPRTGWARAGSLFSKANRDDPGAIACWKGLFSFLEHQSAAA
jgi:hypothetical protein